jgi:hypothetical protein
VLHWGVFLNAIIWFKSRPHFTERNFWTIPFISFSFYISFLMMDLITKCLSKIWYFYDGAFVNEIQMQIEISRLVQWTQNQIFFHLRKVCNVNGDDICTYSFFPSAFFGTFIKDTIWYALYKFCKVEKLGIEILSTSPCLEDLSSATWAELSGFLRPYVPQGYQRVRKVHPPAT